MFKSHVKTVSLLTLTVSVYACLLATANAQTLAQKSSAAVTIQAQGKRSLQPVAGVAAVVAQVENATAEVTAHDVKLFAQDQKISAGAPLPPETFCALLSKYLSLS